MFNVDFNIYCETENPKTLKMYNYSNGYLDLILHFMSIQNSFQTKKRKKKTNCLNA